MNIITDNYIIIIIVGSFLVFALIGYIIDILRNNNKVNEKNDFVPEVSPAEIKKIEDEKPSDTNEEVMDNSKSNPDELLENYDNEV